MSLVLAGAAKPDRGATSPSEVYATFESAVSTRDFRALMRVCGKALANFSPGLSCGSLLNEAWYSGRTYAKASERSNPAAGKAVIEIKSTQNGVDLPLFFLIEQEKSGLWVLKNINDNRTWSDQFLEQRSSTR
jgi:hypothetical protein